MEARELPDLLEVGRDLLGSVVDREAVLDLRRPGPGHGIQEPVRVHHVRPQRAEELPLPRQYLIGGRNDMPARLCRRAAEHLTWCEGMKGRVVGRSIEFPRCTLTCRSAGAPL